MKKQLRKLLSALLVLTMLLSALPMGVFAEEEHTPVTADELTEEATKELNADPTAEPTEEPAAEPIVDSIDDALETATAGEPETEPEKEPAAESTAAPIVDSTDDALETATTGEPETEPEKEPAAEPTVAPAADSTDDALEAATAGEPETEPEKKPETTPAAEDEVDEGKPEEIPAPAENADDDPLAGLTDKQRKTLSSLPEGFSADVVASAMLRSTGCAHDGELFISHSYTGTSSKIVDNKKHILSIGIAYYYLHCFKCDEIIQEIYRPSTIIIEEEHTWTWAHSYYQPIGSIYDFECQACGAIATINPPCSHGKLVKGADLYLHCPDCDVIAWPEIEERTECKHTHYTVDYPNTQQDEYLRWTVDLHLKNTTATVYEEEDSNTWGYDAKCNDCGRPILYKDGKINTLYNNYGCGLAYHKNIKSVLEAHSFVNGVCEYCGEEQTEEICQHTETKRVENVDKRTSALKLFSETEHEVTTTKYYELHCVKCDAYISSDGSDTTTDNQPHDFGNGDTCACGYTKAVEPSGKSVIKNVSISANAKACVEKVGGETFAVTVTCNLDTVCVEMYFGKEHNQNTYRDSSDYVEANGNRIFKMTYTLGEDGKSYAGEYPISVRPFSYVDRANWKNNQMGEEVKITLKVTHDNVSTVSEGGYSYSWSANGHTRMQTITTTLECKVCGNVSKSSTKIAKGGEEPHDLGEDERCSVCEYGRWTDEDYKKEDERLRKLGNDIYTKIRSGDNDIRVPFPNGFGGYGGTYKCGTFVGLQARKLGFDYLNCYGKRFSGQPDGRDWCNYSRDIEHDWSGSRNGLGENLEIENTVDGKHYKQRIYLEKDAKEDCCLYDLLTANGNKNVYNVIISYSQKYNPNKEKQTRLCLHEPSDIMALSQQRGCHHGEITASA